MYVSDVLGITEGALVACVGAGGKSSLLMTLGTELKRNKKKFIVSSTTKMFFNQVVAFAPVYTADYTRGRYYLEKNLSGKGYAAWFKRWRGIKIDGIPPRWINELHREYEEVTIIIEADGARRKLIKAPGPHEPSVPELTDMLLGVLSLRALGRSLFKDTVHRLDKVLELLEKEEGDIITTEDLALLAGSKEGIFRDCPGRKVLVLTGMSDEIHFLSEDIIQAVKRNNRVGIEQCIITKGYGENMIPVGVFEL